MHSAAILAGGHATRFGGRDKSSLVVDGRTIRERQLAVLSVVADDVMIAGRDADGGRAPAGPPEGGRHVRFVADRVAGCGPMGGLHAALAAARHDRVLVLACDMPGVTAPFAAYLLDLAADADAVVPQTEDGYHPLCGVYTRACLPAVERRLAARQLAIRLLFEDVRVRIVGPEEIERFGDRRRLLANINAPDEYAGLETPHGHER